MTRLDLQAASLWFFFFLILFLFFNSHCSHSNLGLYHLLSKILQQLHNSSWFCVLFPLNHPSSWLLSKNVKYKADHITLLKKIEQNKPPLMIAIALRLILDSLAYLCLPGPTLYGPSQPSCVLSPAMWFPQPWPWFQHTGLHKILKSTYKLLLYIAMFVPWQRIFLSSPVYSAQLKYNFLCETQFRVWCVLKKMNEEQPVIYLGQLCVNHYHSSKN